MSDMAKYERMDREVKPAEMIFEKKGCEEYWRVIRELYNDFQRGWGNLPDEEKEFCKLYWRARSELHGGLQ